MISGVTNVSFTGKTPKVDKFFNNQNIKSSSEYIRGYRGIMDSFLTSEKLEKEQYKAIMSGNFAFLQGVKDAVAKIAEQMKKPLNK